MLFEKLPQNEKDMIVNWIQTYGTSNRDYNAFPVDMASLSYILRAWDANKQALYKLLGEQFILEREVTYQRPSDFLRTQLNDALDHGDMRLFKDKLFREFDKHYSYWSVTYGNMRRLFNIDNLKDNRFNGSSCEIVLNENVSFSIPRGTKVMKVLNKMAKHFHLEEEFEKFRIEHSQILNQKLLKGTLCLSIHPFDYMTMSDNTYDWDSCMNWENNGCYRTGTIEMMNSAYVIVAYLKGDKPFRVNDDMWSGNKKWRELFIVHPHAICNIKPYPYANEVISDMALEWLRELATTNLEWDIPYDSMQFWSEESFKYHDDKDYRMSFYTYRMYNDFNTANTCHKIFIPQGRQDTSTDFIVEDIEISGPNICMCCGQEWDPEEGCEDHVLCFDCDPGPRCSCCGRAYDEDEMYYVEGDVLCEACYEDQAGRCVLSDEYYYNDNLVDVYLTPVDDRLDCYQSLNYIQVHERYTQPNGLQYEKQCFNIDTIRRTEIDGELVYYFNMSDCQEYCIDDLFGLWSAWTRERYITNYKNELAEQEK